MAKIAVLIGDEYEDSEYDVPVAKLRRAGHQLTTVGEERGKRVQGKRGKSEVVVELAAKDARAEDYSVVLIPGGHSPDHLRIDDDVVRFVEKAIRAGKVIAAICHGPQLLIEADACRGVRMTSWPSVRKDLINAGAHWEDAEVVEDGNFITSRKPEDATAFTQAVLNRLSPATEVAAASW